MKKRILITGATGLLGLNLTYLLRDKYEVFTISRHPLKNNPSNVNYIYLDFNSKWHFRDLPKNLYAIIHLAQSPNFKNFPDMAINIFNVNIASTAFLLDYAKLTGVNKFIYASSGGIYRNGRLPMDENSPLNTANNLGYYLGSKLSGEILSQSYNSFFNVILLRFFFIYGPLQNKDMLIPRLMGNILNKRPISLQGKNGIYLNPIHVSDASNAVSASLSLDKSDIINIAGPEIVSIRSLSECMGKFLNISPIFSQIAGEPQSLIGDNTKMIDLLAKPSRRITDSLSDIPL